MKISYNHIVNSIPTKPSIEELSEKLFQLGHENEVDKGIFDIEFTPNRGDCLSVLGILRDLAVFYKIENVFDIYKDDIQDFSLDFTNFSKESCPNISFLKIKIDNNISPYKGMLKSYFDEFSLNRNNFFTDISNYISYETGQPTHCYDYQKISSGNISLRKINKNIKFETLLDKTITLSNENLVFMHDEEIINLAGVIGGSNSSCDESTTDVLIECAFFQPEEIIGKTVKYDLASEAAYKFERGVNPKSHDFVLRRFAKLVSDHAPIIEISLFNQNNKEHSDIKISDDVMEINKILGTDLNKDDYHNILIKLGLKVSNELIHVPSHRSDIKHFNDLAEEIARVIGYDNIKRRNFCIHKTVKSEVLHTESQIKDLLIDNGFYEVINDPFTEVKDNRSIKLDNPLDSNKSCMRTDLESSLVKNLTYNERRQKDSIKLFEVSDVYSLNNGISKKRKIGIICSGRIGKNYRDFSKIIDDNYLKNILGELLSRNILNIRNLSRENLNSKSKKPIFYLEFEIDDSIILKQQYSALSSKPKNYNKYVDISEFPSSFRDLSFSIKDYSKLSELEDLILDFHHKSIKDIFAFDYFVNDKIKEIKIGFRFVFQSKNKTLTDNEIDIVMNKIIESSQKIDGVLIPGLGS